MATLIKNIRVLDCSKHIDVTEDVLITREHIEIAPRYGLANRIIDGRNLLLVPGLIDLHVHFREPGFTHKEDIASGIKAALRGGVTSALVMPNTLPVIDTPKAVEYQLKRASKTGFDLMVAAAASVGLQGEIATDGNALKHAGAKAVTDDGRPIMSDLLMEKVLRECRRYDLLCMQHAEDLCVSQHRSMHQGIASRHYNIDGQPSASEFNMVKRDIALAEKLNARYHVLHLSCKESLRLIRMAKKNKSQISCEVTPHHLLLSELDVRGLNTRKKMNPPLRSESDASILLEGLSDGSIDAVASDHAPHSQREKALPFEQAPFGVVGLESAVLVLLTLVKRGKLSLTRAIEAMTKAPARILGEELRLGTMIGEGARSNAVVLDLNYKSIFSERNLAGRSKNSPFIGMELYGRVMHTFLNGEICYSAERK